MDVFEAGDTLMFTFTSSVAPDAAPTFSVKGIVGTLVSSSTSNQSDTTHYYALYTMPTSEGFYLGQWNAQKTFQGSPWPFIKRFAFKVNETDKPA